MQAHISVTIRLPAELGPALEREAKAKGMRPTALVALAVRSYLDSVAGVSTPPTGLPVIPPAPPPVVSRFEKMDREKEAAKIEEPPFPPSPRQTASVHIVPNLSRQVTPRFKS
jgi:hypothetical protein